MDMLEKIETRLTESGLRQTQLEKLAGLSHGRISKWKDGQGEPTASQALRIARLLNVPVQWLIDPEAPDEPAAADGLTADDRAVLEFCHDLGIGRREALRRLATAAQAAAQPAPEVANGHVARPLDPDTGAPLASPRSRKGRRA